jgi:hypothetical protein
MHGEIDLDGNPVEEYVRSPGEAPGGIAGREARQRKKSILARNRASMIALKLTICALQAYFLLMNFTVERYYCHNPLIGPGSHASGLLIAETVTFAQAHNPLFLARPEWLRVATCISAYGLCWGYMLTLLAALTEAWRLCAIWIGCHGFNFLLGSLAVPLLLFVGAKTYAIGCYHLMEFSSATPPQYLCVCVCLVCA